MFSHLPTQTGFSLMFPVSVNSTVVHPVSKPENSTPLFFCLSPTSNDPSSSVASPSYEDIFHFGPLLFTLTPASFLQVSLPSVISSQSRQLIFLHITLMTSSLCTAPSSWLPTALGIRFSLWHGPADCSSLVACTLFI